MEKVRILWADDEIALLKPHILFLENKGYEVVTAISRRDSNCSKESFRRDSRRTVVRLVDQNMVSLLGEGNDCPYTPFYRIDASYNQCS